MTPDITVVIPAYAAAGFIDETLDSVQAQTYSAWRALVAIDPADDDTETICRARAAEDPRFEVRVNRRRLGWIGNHTAAMRRARTPFVMQLPHDDLLADDYLERLRAALVAHPEAVAAHPDLHRFGMREHVQVLDSLVGTPTERVCALLDAPLGSIPFRAMLRRSVLRSGLVLRSGEFGDFFADVLWVVELALLGDCLRVPDVVYHKRVRQGSVVRGWEAMPAADKRAAWVEHLVRVLSAVRAAGATHEEIARVAEALVRRLDGAPEQWRAYDDDDGRRRFWATVIATAMDGD